MYQSHPIKPYTIRPLYYKHENVVFILDDLFSKHCEINKKYYTASK